MRASQRVLTAIGALGLLAAVAYPLGRVGVDRVAGSLAWIAVGVIPFFAVGVWLTHRRPDHPQARWLLLMGVAGAVGAGMEGPLRNAFLETPAQWWLPWLNMASQYTLVLTLVAGSLLLASFPDGVIENPWQRAVVNAQWAQLAIPPLLLLTVPFLVTDRFLVGEQTSVPSPLVIPGLEWLGPPLVALLGGYYTIVIGVLVLLIRFGTADRTQRRRMRLMVYTASTAVLITMASNVLPLLGFGESSPAMRIVDWLYIPLAPAIPLVIVAGVLQHRLFDIDLTVRRSVVYGGLVLAISALYVVLTAAPGLAFGSRIPVEVAVVITVVAAVAFQPVRRRFQTLADRWVFGEKVDRYQVLTAFGAELEQTVELPQLLPKLADAVRRGLDASWVRVWLPGAQAAAGEPYGATELTVALPGAGGIECGPKPGGYDVEDRELLDTLVGQAATAIANVRLTAQLAERLDELTASRARLVAAADAERRRIERDLHDGVQQHVVALLARIRLARNAQERATLTGDQLAAVQADAAELLVDLRELAHGIHPPVLSDRGLVEAVETRADRMPVPVATHADPGLRESRFAADVEAAAYFVVCEALTNIVKHAGARTADVALSTEDGHLTVRVRDDGSGGAGSRDGHGLTNLRDRVEALGGRLRVAGTPGAGSCVEAELPVGAGRG